MAVPSSFIITSAPPASSEISPATSTVRSPELKSISVPSMFILSTLTPALAVTAPVAATVPAAVTFAPLKVRAVVVPDFIIRLPEVLVALPNVVPSSLKNISASFASSEISPATSTVRSPELKSISVPSMFILSTTTPALAVTEPLKDAAPASDISMVNAVIALPPSFPLKIISLS